MKIKSKRHKKSAIKRKVKFEDFKHCLEAIQLENKISQPEIDKFDEDSAQEIHKELIKTIN